MDRVIYNFDSLPQRHGLASAPKRRSIYRARRTPEPRVGIIYNPRSHRNHGQDLACSGADSIMVAQPRTRDEIAHALAGFARDGIDFLVINGGDGTVRDVLTMGQTVFADRWPAIAVLPKGKTNALNVDLGAPADWSLEGALAAYASGRQIIRRPLAVSREDHDDPAMLGFIFGAGAFTLGIEAGQDAHSLGFFNSLAVGATSAWGVIQGLFGSNRNKWRRGTPMQLTYLPSGKPVPRSAHGDPARRAGGGAVTTRSDACALLRRDAPIEPTRPMQGRDRVNEARDPSSRDSDQQTAIPVEHVASPRRSKR